jgi:hypothetical protein
MIEKHTAGPWYVTTSDEKGFVFAHIGKCIVPFCDETAGNMDGENWANARLIASAPDLLAALELCRECLNPAQSWDSKKASAAWLAARDAIRKARGE